tara:strand:- start:110 stop:484 length:375 start_codon:yes stop_codon:yes gene_type:complete
MKLKHPHQRKPEESVTWAEILKEVGNETGYVQTDVEAVLLSYLGRVQFHLLDRKRIRLRGIGELYPLVKPPRKITNLGRIDDGKYKIIQTQAKWKLVFTETKAMSDKVKDIVVTDKDLSKIYKQ